MAPGLPIRESHDWRPRAGVLHSLEFSLLLMTILGMLTCLARAVPIKWHSSAVNNIEMSFSQSAFDSSLTFHALPPTQPSTNAVHARSLAQARAPAIAVFPETTARWIHHATGATGQQLPIFFGILARKQDTQPALWPVALKASMDSERGGNHVAAAGTSGRYAVVVQDGKVLLSHFGSGGTRENRLELDGVDVGSGEWRMAMDDSVGLVLALHINGTLRVFSYA
ncbi:hypothetical protein B0H13DRAFT_2373442 [Mycena leptocephala]|nr:hypothetical protein B0H13DRAFT_2373442 [Mycena leptocephala]